MSEEGARIVVVDDEPNIRRLVVGVLEDEGHRCETADSVEALRAIVADRGVDLVLLDVCLPGDDGLTWLREREPTHAAAVVMMSGHGTIDLALQATRLGAVDFLEKPIRGERLLLAVENALTRVRLQRENDALRRAATRRLVGNGPSMRALRGSIERAARTDATVLVTGENGTGKELVARALHESSARRDGPYVQLNCAAIPATLLESELFGHEAGAFSGAVRRRRGHVERAHRGTLLLDEIGDMPLELQAKLLRVLEEGRVTRLGAETPTAVDVRVVASTHRDLRRRIEEGSFREDLYFRLAVLEVHVPALRERPEDVELLARHFLAAYAHDFARDVPEITPDAIEALRRRTWDGNVRELRNLMARHVALGEGRALDAVALDALEAPGAREGEGTPPVGNLQATLDATERDLIRRALDDSGGNKAAAARALGIDRANLHRKMKRLGLDPS